MEQMLNSYVTSKRFREAMSIAASANVDLKLLAQGEYNINYLFTNPTTKERLVLRVNTASQMHLPNQIEYEYNALKLLKPSRRTPASYYVDGTKELIPYGVLVMEYLRGRPLDYAADMEKAAAIFSDIHSTDISAAEFLIKPKNLQQAMLHECKATTKAYMDCLRGDRTVKHIIQRLIEKQEDLLVNGDAAAPDYRIINTEVNSGNFIINEDISNCYLVDWEKPILGEAAQDLAHFLAPTTTFWKTDVILDQEQQKAFIRAYVKAVNNRFQCRDIEYAVRRYLSLNCLRGISWCAMAWVQYTEGSKTVMNQESFYKIEAYLKKDFLDMVEGRYFR